MQLQVGDWVRTEKGEVAKVVHISRLTAFVEIKQDGTLVGYLISQLTKIDPPKTPDPN
jgi:hypothetical protein